MRRLCKVCVFFWVLTCGAVISVPAHAKQDAQSRLETEFRKLEDASGGRLGVSATDTETGRRVQYRADERFPFCSTFKTLLVAAILKKSETDTGLLEKNISYSKKDLVSWAPVTQNHLSDGMSIFNLCAAALQYSDNTAANLLLREVGGPESLTAFARSIKDSMFVLNRWETELNSALPGDERDTTTPSAMEASLSALVLGGVLGEMQTELLQNWLKGNTTGTESIRAGVPGGWSVGDKTGSGGYGTTNDIAVIWPPSGKPMVLAVYFTQNKEDAPARRDILARVAELIIEEFEKARTSFALKVK